MIFRYLKNELPAGSFKVWISPLKGEVDGTTIRLEAYSSFAVEHIQHKLADSVLLAASKALEIPQEKLSLDFTVSQRKPLKRATFSASSPESAPEALPATMDMQQCMLPIAKMSYSPAAFSLPEWKYSFNDFVVGSSNDFAVAAARDLSSPKSAAATLFLSSASGLGKTHLAHAIGHAISSGRSMPRLAYMTAEDFASRFVVSIREKNVGALKEHLCAMDVLLLEDVHFLQGKGKIQEMVLSVVKSLQDRGKKVIFTSSFTPRELQSVDSHLVSHFASGLLTQMEKPTLDMRCDILQRKARSHQVILPEDLAELIARRISDDVRQLESCLNNLIFKARLLKKGLTLEMTLDMLEQYAGNLTALDLDSIIDLVCQCFTLTRQQLCSRSRRRDYVLGRNAIYYLARKHTSLSLQEIGGNFNRKHSTVIKGITSVERELQLQSNMGRQLASSISLIERKAGIVRADF